MSPEATQPHAPQKESTGSAEILASNSVPSPAALSLAQTPQNPATPSVLLTVPQSTKPRTLIQWLKAWAWRITAGYFCVHSAILIVAGRDLLSGAESRIVTGFINALSYLGFAPVHVSHLPLVFKAMWLLAITEFSPVQLIGFLLYSLVFPFTVLGAWIYRKTLRDTDSSAATPAPSSGASFPLNSLLTALLAGWFVLYGGSSSRAPNLAGFLFSAALFLALIYQALDKTSPIDESDTAFFSSAAARGLLIISSLFKTAAEQPPKTKLAVASALKIHGFVIRCFRRIGICIHSRKGRERIAMAMLLEYIVFLAFVATSAILMWALAIKAAVPSEQALPLTTALQVSASHFFPGIQDSSVSVPWWAQFGPAFTSWILFVVYIGPVGSALPMQQEAFLKRLAPSRPVFKLIGRVWRLYRNFLTALENTLPPK